MSNIVLGKRPKNFAPCAVKFVMPDGGEGVISATFKYRTKIEFGEMLDSIFNADTQAVAAPAPAVAEKPARSSRKTAAAAAPVVDPLAPFRVDITAQYRMACDRTADHLLLSLEAWDLPYPLNSATLQQLAAELPAATTAIMAAYNVACTEGRLGN